MPDPKSVTIKLTDKQRTQIKRLTGEEHQEVRFEREALPGQAAPRVALSGAAPKKISFRAGKQLSAVAGKKISFRAGKRLSAVAGKKISFRAGRRLSVAAAKRAR